MMNWKLTVGIVAVLIGCLVGAILLVTKHRSQAPVSVTLRVAVTPAEQVDFVIAQGKSAKFKYLVGRLAGVKPVLAQRLSLKAVPNTTLVEAQVGVLTNDQARRYVEVFVPTLQVQCGKQAQLALANQSIR